MRLTSFLNLPAPGRCHSLYVASIGLAERCVFVKQSVGPFHCGPSYDGHPFSRSYRVNLPSSLTTAHSSTLVYSTHPPVSVYGTDCLHNSHEDFLASLIVPHSDRRISPYCRRSAQVVDLPATLIAYDLQRTSNRARGFHFWVPP